MEKEMNTCLEKGKKKDVKQGKAHYLDQITEDDTNVIIRTEFSKGTLLFSEQHDELRDMVAQFGNFMSDVTFVGHSMGSQQGDGYKNVNVLPPIIGNNGVMIIPPIVSMWKPYYHTKTPEHPGVINQIDKFIGSAS